MSAPVDVLAVISAEVRRRRNSQNSKNRDGQFADADRAGAKAAEMEAARAAVAELIEADKELDAAYAEFPGLRAERAAIEKAAMRVNVAIARRTAAIANVGGAST